MSQRDVSPVARVGTGLPPALSAAPDLPGLMQAFRRRWQAAVAVGLALALGAGASAWLLVPKSKYSARATLHVSTQPKYIIFDPRERLSDYRTYQKTQVALARSRFVQLDALRRPGIAELETVRDQADADEWLSKSIKIDFPDASEVLQISLDGERPAELAALVNAILDSYMDLIVKQEQVEREARLETLKKLWAKYKENLQTKRKALRELSESIGSHDQQTLTMAQQSKIQQLDLCEQELMQVKSGLRKTNSDLAVLEARVEASEGESISETAVDQEVDSNSELRDLAARAEQLEEKYTRLAGKARNAIDDPVVASVRDQLRSARDRLTRRRAAIRVAVSTRLRGGRVADDRAALIKLQSQISASKIYQAALEEEIAQLKGQSRTINRGSLDISQQQDDLRLVVETTQRIGAEVEAMEVELGAPPRTRVIDRAGVPNRRNDSRRLKAGVGAGAVTAALSLLGVSFWEFRARRIGTIDDVVHGLGMKLVGALPILPRHPRRKDLASLSRSQSILVESIDAARTMILHASRTEPIRVLMVGSAHKGEGKTSLSCLLSTSLARSGRRTLLVDCDLRSPAAHRPIDCLPGPGLSELLRGELGLDEVIQLTATDGLQFIAAGRSDEAAIQSLAQDRAHLLFDELRRRYDFVVVDTSPVLLVADTLLVAGLSDAVIFSIMRDVSRLPLVHSAYERLSELGVRMLGAVVAGTAGETYGYEYRDTTGAEGES